MKVRSVFLQDLHLDTTHSLLSARSVNILLHLFNHLDIHKKKGLNDIQFCQFLISITDLNKARIYKVFDMLDVDASGEIEFDEFYMLICILIAHKDNEEKHFIYRHSRTVFDLLDEDGSKTVSAEEFEAFGFLFNFQTDAIRRIFSEFDITGDQELDYKEFRMFAMACIDKQRELKELQKRRRREKHSNVFRWLLSRIWARFNKNDASQNLTFYKEGEEPKTVLETPAVKTTGPSGSTMSIAALGGPSTMKIGPKASTTAYKN